jgi:N-acyl-L-homoserine lactone synthetase
MSQNRHKHADLLHEAFFKCNQDVPVDAMVRDDIPQAIYFVAMDEWFGVCGFAQLVPTVGGSQTWELRDIHILLSESVTRRYSEDVLAIFAGCFYLELFKAVYRTAQQQGIQKIVMATSAETIQDVWNVGWPLRELGGDCVYLEVSPESYEEVLNHHKLFEQNVALACKSIKRVHTHSD